MAPLSSKWLVLLGCFVGLACGANPVMAFTFSLFIEPLNQEFGWSRSVISLGYSAAVVAPAFAAPLVGWLLDKYGVRILLLSGIVLFGATLASLSLTTSPLTFVGLYALVGVFGLVQGPLSYVKAISEWFDKHRGVALGLAMAGMSMGGLLLPYFVRSVLVRADWREAYVALGALVTIIAFTAVFLFVRTPQRSAPSGAGASAQTWPGLEPREALADYRFWAVVGWIFFMSMALNGTAAHAMPMLLSQGASAPGAVSLVSMLAVASLLGRVFGGYLLDRFFAPLVASVLAIIAAIGLMCVLLGGEYMMIGIALTGFGLGAEVDVVSYLVSRYFGLRKLGQIFSYAFLTILLSAALGAQAMGLSFDLAGSYDSALLAFVGMLTVSVFLPFCLGRYRFPVEGAPRAVSAQPQEAS